MQNGVDAGAAIEPQLSGAETTRPSEHTLPLHDREQLGRLLASLEPRLRAVALRITRHPEHARDVVQNAFEKVLLHGERFQGQARVSTWLHRIVANEALMWLRSQRRRGEVPVGVDGREDLEALLPADRADGPVERLLGRERARQLHRGLDRLAPDERDVVLSCALSDESYAAYGARTGLHPAAAKSRAFRARQRLGTLLRELSGR